MKYFLLFIISFFLSFCEVNAQQQNFNEVLTNAISENIVYDSEFDYSKLKRFSNLRIYPEGYRESKHLVDKVIVYKSHKRMLLLKGDKIIRQYWIALSDRPEGHKQFQGDRRTPEGQYTLDYIKEKSVFYKAFHISYPNSQDIENARRLGKDPGGLIMVHGQPASNSEYHDSVQRSNWTNGCIAILNPEMDEFIALVDPGTPIIINP